jgi:hypothetical protein
LSSVDDFLQRLANVDESVDLLSGSVGLSVGVVDSLSRGIAVNGLIALEQFVRDRADEWVTVITAARVSPTAMPGGAIILQDRLAQVLPRRLRDAQPAQRAQLIADLSRTLASFSSSAFVAHSLPFNWSGSNIQVADLEAILAMVGLLKEPWGQVTALWSRVDPRFPGNVNARSLFEAVADPRHGAAHSANASLPLANLQNITRSARLLGLCFDVLVSSGIRQMCRGVSPVRVLGGSVPLRKVLRDGQVWREYNPGSTARAFRRHASLSVAMSDAATRASAAGELVLARDGNDIVDWRYDC